MKSSASIIPHVHPLSVMLSFSLPLSFLLSASHAIVSRVLQGSAPEKSLVVPAAKLTQCC